MPDTDALLPCPFCGSDRITHSAIRDGGSVHCNICSASVVAYHGPTTTGLQEAIAAWNTRANPDAQSRHAADEQIRVLEEALAALADMTCVTDRTAIISPFHSGNAELLARIRLASEAWKKARAALGGGG